MRCTFFKISLIDKSKNFGRSLIPGTHCIVNLGINNKTEADVYEIKEDAATNTVAFVNPKVDKPTLREIVYYHMIERPYGGDEGRARYDSEEGPDFDDTMRPFTNSHGFPFMESVEKKILSESPILLQTLKMFQRTRMTTRSIPMTRPSPTPSKEKVKEDVPPKEKEEIIIKDLPQEDEEEVVYEVIYDEEIKEIPTTVASEVSYRNNFKRNLYSSNNRTNNGNQPPGQEQRSNH
ncbi:hypothetical protein ABMA28_011586 [Loxostege sticticalis]|uniref:Uncharacterized protein n=1 Tax=Loxostege sticticalis TaxID=481309 RepID=A0ABD0S5Q5_LOXSC